MEQHMILPARPHDQLVIADGLERIRNSIVGGDHELQNFQRRVLSR